MANGNEVTLIGNITSDIDLRITPQGTAVAKFGLAWNRRYERDGGQVDEAHFFDVTAWRDLADNVAESFSKGDRVIVVGRMDFQSWEDKDTGAKRSRVGVVADDVAASARFATLQVHKVERGDAPSRSRSSDRGRGDEAYDRPQRDRGGRPSRGDYYDEQPF